MVKHTIELDAHELVSGHIRELYQYPQVVEERHLIEYLTEKKIPKDVIKKVLTDRAGNELRYDPSIKIGVMKETVLDDTNLSPRIVKRRYLIYSYCPTDSQSRGFFLRYRPLKNVRL